jgi:cytochrome c oxidase subunit 2
MVRIRHAHCVVLAASLAACSKAPQNYMAGTGSAAAETFSRLGWQALIAFIVATVITWILIVWLALRRRGTLAEHAPVDSTGNQSWILIGGFAIPFAVLLILFISMLDSFAASPMHMGAQHGPEIRVTGQRWWFKAEYQPGAGNMQVSAPTEIHVPVGRPVEIELRSVDVIHSFWIPKLQGKVDLVPGLINHVRIEAREPGVYQGQCAEFCGMQHAQMRLQVVAQSESDYQSWLARQREVAAVPVDDLARRGQGVFMSAACPVCHQVRGTPAHGTVGPDLTHVGSRRRIAGGAFENNTANLAAWITHAQSMKPGSQMPDLT